MGNSSLISYTNRAKYDYGKRTHSIDTITIHCFVGQVTSIRGCDYFATIDRKASCNYVIGKDGDIGLSVPEDCAAMTSSNKANDERAITFEVASDTVHPYKVTDKALDSIINLCADICKRNNISKLVWSNNKSDRVNHTNGCNMTVHRDYASKACPGDYLMSKMQYIADSVNKLLNTKNNTNNSIDLTEKDIYEYLINKGLTHAGASGLMGNLFAESGLKANNLQNNGNKHLTLTDDEFVAMIDNDMYSKETFINDKYGFGLAQWTYWTRKKNLYDYMKDRGLSIADTKGQLDFMLEELAGYRNIDAVLRTTSSLKEASDIVLLQYEKPADQSDNVKAKRLSFGQVYFDKYKPVVNNKQSFKVRVLVSDLNIRKQPSSKAVVVGQTGKGVFTITETSGSWGKLKSGLGWIYLGNSNYAVRL